MPLGLHQFSTAGGSGQHDGLRGGQCPEDYKFPRSQGVGAQDNSLAWIGEHCHAQQGAPAISEVCGTKDRPRSHFHNTIRGKGDPHRQRAGETVRVFRKEISGVPNDGEKTDGDNCSTGRDHGGGGACSRRSHDALPRCAPVHLPTGRQCGKSRGNVSQSQSAHTHTTHAVQFRYKRMQEVVVTPSPRQSEQPPAKKRRLYSEEERSILKSHFKIGEGSKVAKISECAEFLSKHQGQDLFIGRTAQNIQDKIKNIIKQAK